MSTVESFYTFWLKSFSSEAPDTATELTNESSSPKYFRNSTPPVAWARNHLQELGWCARALTADPCNKQIVKLSLLSHYKNSLLLSCWRLIRKLPISVGCLRNRLRGSAGKTRHLRWLSKMDNGKKKGVVWGGKLGAGVDCAETEGLIKTSES